MVLVRRIILYVFYVACVLVVLIALLFIGAVIKSMFSGFGGSVEFVEKEGASAKRLMNSWPRGVDPSKVHSVSRKYAYSIDSHSIWYKVKLDQQAAADWADTVHVDRERYSLESVRSDDRGLEAVRRLILGPPPLHRTSADPPSWWKPPAIAFRATEAMKWYSGIDSGVGQAAYTGYDEAQQTLWVYEYACQRGARYEPTRKDCIGTIKKLSMAKATESLEISHCATR